MTKHDGRAISVLHGGTFVVSDALGDLAPEVLFEHGFYARDTRYVSRCVLRVDGRSPAPLSVAQDDHVAAQFFMTAPDGDVFTAPTLALARQRVVADVWLEEIALMNHAREPAQVRLDIDLACDFADLFEVKRGAVRAREVRVSAEADALSFEYERSDFLRRTTIGFDQPASAQVGGEPLADGDAVTGEGGATSCLCFRAAIEPHGRWKLTLTVAPGWEGRTTRRPRARFPDSFDRMTAQLRSEVEAWREGAPTLETDWEPLRLAHARSIDDLAALRFRPLNRGGFMPAAGLPWFMALFGRDSLIASYQALPFLPALAASTLRVLADLQAEVHDDFQDAEPGKIAHELRFGELTAFGDEPHSPYYGTVDATPLFLILLDEYERWTGDVQLVRELEPNARAALGWIEATCAGHPAGLVSYRCRNAASGLVNQCWKDSWNSMVFADGRLAAPPIAPCETQGYAYDALERCARLAAVVWGDAALARELARRAELIRGALRERLWIAAGRYMALALDGADAVVDSRASNMGHLLWSGALDEEAADGVARALMDERLFSGWGVRTLAAGEGAYNPIEYHNGTVWPHDSSIAAAGLARYGRRDEANRLSVALMRAAAAFGGRLPEVFAGYGADTTRVPVEYPTSSRPQAWAAGASLLLVRTVLGLEPAGEHLACDPRLPPEIGYLALRDIPGRWGRVDVVATQRRSPGRALSTALDGGSPRGVVGTWPAT
jgi:glycogen debranching enzyme